jgi:hypothetical protein
MQIGAPRQFTDIPACNVIINKNNNFRGERKGRCQLQDSILITGKHEIQDPLLNVSRY